METRSIWINRRMLFKWKNTDSFCPSKEKPIIMYKILTPIIGVYKTSSEMGDPPVTSVYLKLDTEFYSHSSDDYISIGFSILGFGLGYSKQVGY